jgi:hypothetical protein
LEDSDTMRILHVSLLSLDGAPARAADATRRVAQACAVATATHVQCLCQTAQEAIQPYVLTRHFLRSHPGFIVLRTKLPVLTANYNVSLVIILRRVERMLVGHSLLGECALSACSYAV